MATDAKPLQKRHFAYPSPRTLGLFAVWDSIDQRYRENQIGDATSSKFILEEYGTHHIAELMAEYYDENPDYRTVKQTTAPRRD